MLTRHTLPSLSSTGLVALFAVAAGAAGIASLTTHSPPPPQQSQLIAQPPGEEVSDDRVCPPGQRECGVDHHEDGTPPSAPGGSPGGSGGGACTFNNGSGVITVSLAAAQSGVVEVPCRLDGMWYDGSGCYYGEPDFNFNDPPPEGKTEEDGRYYSVHCLMSVRGELPFQSYVFNALRQHAWVDFEDVPQVTPEQVALDLLARIGLDGVEFALSPPETGAGLVGLPVWLGIGESANAWGPIGDSECVGDVCVSIEALVTEVAWDMGDGTVITCARDQHVAWRSGMDFRSPGSNCHHFYDRASRHLPDRRYQLTATSFWQVTWSSDDDGGVIETERTATASMQIDEIQVLRSQ